MSRALDVSTSYLVSIGRLGAGHDVVPLGERPSATLILYEFEGCPYCRKVREALTMLDLEAEIRPCPKGGRRFRDELVARAGKSQFPYLVDPGVGIEMFESDDIVHHLFDRYGDGSVPLSLGLGLLTDLSSILSGLARPRAGTWVKRSRMPERPLELYSMESSPYCRLVRETLSELELPYLLHNVAKASPSREVFVKRSGRMLVPWLSDPNTGTELFESGDIVRYLRTHYEA
jgi:glutathione S-transferase